MRHIADNYSLEFIENIDIAIVSTVAFLLNFAYKHDALFCKSVLNSHKQLWNPSARARHCLDLHQGNRYLHQVF